LNPALSNSGCAIIQGGPYNLDRGHASRSGVNQAQADGIQLETPPKKIAQTVAATNTSASVVPDSGRFDLPTIIPGVLSRRRARSVSWRRKNS
jgi:hypothetical protein